MPNFSIRIKAIMAVLVLIALATTLLTADSEGGGEGVGTAEVGEASGTHALAGVILALLVLAHMATNYKMILHMGKSFLPKKGKKGE
jgi:hypothetical protein